MKSLTFTYYNNIGMWTKLCVMPCRIVAVGAKSDGGDGSYLFLTNGSEVEVVESYDHVLSLLQIEK